MGYINLRKVTFGQVLNQLPLENFRPLMKLQDGQLNEFVGEVTSDHPDWIKNAHFSKYVWFFKPRRSHASGKIIWLKRGYITGCTYQGGFLDTFTVSRFYTRDEFIVLCLKG